jgi:hypothetical protein
MTAGTGKKAAASGAQGAEDAQAIPSGMRPDRDCRNAPQTM